MSCKSGYSGIVRFLGQVLSWFLFKSEVSSGGLLFLSLGKRLSLQTHRSMERSCDRGVARVGALGVSGHQMGVAEGSGSAVVGY